MKDWRNLSQKTRDRVSQVSVRGSGKGVIGAFIDTSSGENQTAKLIYSGGEKNLPLPMPFESATSWIRSIPEAATGCVVAFRSDTEEPTFISYLNDSPKQKIEGYSQAINVYRPLVPGEHEIHSSGMANSYYSARPNLEHRAGLVRSWLDQDRLESGQKAPIHTRQIWEHNSSKVGDEERFGVVRRPMNFLLKNPAAALLALSPTSYIFYDYPYPDFSLPGGVPAAFNITAAAAATASEVALGLVGEFKKRPFAKEYLKIIKNPLFPLPPNAKLIDFREGQVFDDLGLQEISFSSGAYLRAKYQYFTPIADSTSWNVDELGNVSWSTSALALNGYSFFIPTGNFKVTTGLDTSVICLNYSSMSLLGTTLSAVTDITLQSVMNTSVTTGINFDVSSLGEQSFTTPLNNKTTAALNIVHEAGVNFDVKAGVKANLLAPLVDIGPAPVTTAVLGIELSTWLADLVSTMITAAPDFCTGNLGASTPLNGALLSKLTQLLAQIPTLTSKTVKVSP